MATEPDVTVTDLPALEEPSQVVEQARQYERTGLRKFLPPDGNIVGIVLFFVLVVALLAMPFILRLGIFDSTRVGQTRAANYLALIYGGMIFAIAAIGLAILVGYTGLLSLGHGGFLAIGGYAIATLATRNGLSPWLVLILIVPLAAAVGALLGLLSARLRGFYFTVMSLIFLPALLAVTNVFNSIFGGSQGKPIQSRISGTANIFGYSNAQRIGDRAAFYLVCMLFLLGSLLLIKSLIHSRFGRAFQAVRESETASAASGISPYRFKVYAVMISAVFVALAGALSVLDPQVSQTSQFGLGINDPTVSFLLVTMNVIGGLGTLAGPLIGAIGFKITPDLLLGSSRAQDLLPFITGLGTILGVVVAPWGTVGLQRAARDRRRLRVARVGPTILGKMKERGVSDSQVAQARKRYTVHRPPIPEVPAAYRRPGPADYGGDTSTDLLVLRSMGKRFGGLQALDDIELTVKRGTIHALIGPNGSGKTTMINCITGFYKPSSGRILLRGEDISTEPAFRRARVGVARTFQNLQIWRRMPVIDNIRVGGHIGQKSDMASSLFRLPWFRKEEEALRQRSWGMLHFMGLAEKGYDPAGSLPFADQRRLEIARALCAQPDLVLLDEPAAGMTPSEVDTLIDLIQEVSRCGITVLLIEHHMDLVMEIADVVTVLDYGKKIAEGPPREVAADPRVIEAYLGAEHRGD